MGFEMATDGKVFDRVSMTWVDVEEMQERRDIWRIKRQLGSNRPFPCPMYISDGQGGIHGVMSMADGQFYDSKSNMRAHYKRDGIVEVGTDSSVTDRGTYRHPRARLKSQVEKDAEIKKELDALRKANSQLNLTSYRKDELT